MDALNILQSVFKRKFYLILKYFFIFRADTLFEIWNKYEPRLPKSYYQEKLLEVGDFLMSSKVFSQFIYTLPPTPNWSPYIFTLVQKVKLGHKIMLL